MPIRRRVRSIASDPLAEAGLLMQLSHLEEKLGKYAEALRWTDQARLLLEAVSGEEAAKRMARSSAWYALVLQAEGRTDDALKWAERTVTEAQVADDAEALGDAHFVIGWAYGELGRPGAEDHMQRSLEAYQRAGDLVRQAGILSSLGVVCQWEGRWDEALSFYERGRDAALKIGSTVPAAIARINVAEILTDRGEWAEAERMLLETLPLWKSSQYRYYLAACLSLLGRVSLRLGRLDEALARLEDAKANFLHVGAEEEVPAIDARIAECRVAMGKLDDALDAGERNAAARRRIERRRARASAAIARAGARVAAAGRPVERARRAGGEPRRGEGAEQPFRGHAHDALADRARPAGGRGARARNGDGDARSAVEPQGARGAAGAAAGALGWKQRSGVAAASLHYVTLRAIVSAGSSPSHRRCRRPS